MAMSNPSESPLYAVYFDIVFTRPISQAELNNIRVHEYTLLDGDTPLKFRFEHTRIERGKHCRQEMAWVDACRLSSDSDVEPTLETLKQMRFGEISVGIPARATFDVQCISNLIFEFENCDMMFHASMEQLFDINKYF